MMKRIALLAASASVMATGAFAGGFSAPVTEAPVVVPAPVVVVAPSLDWTGGYAGLSYGTGSADLNQSGTMLDETDIDGWGIHGGYMWDMGQYVLGGELDYSSLSSDTDQDYNLLRLKGRAGYDMGRFLPYVTLGVAQVSSDISGVDYDDTGLTYGLGAEYLLNDKFSLGLEYTRNSFSDVAEDLLGAGADLDADLLQLRGSFRF